MRRVIPQPQGSNGGRPLKREAGQIPPRGRLTRLAVYVAVCVGLGLLATVQLAVQTPSVAAQQPTSTLPPRPTIEPTLPPRPTIEPTLPPRPTIEPTLPPRPTIAPTLPARPTLPPTAPPGAPPGDEAVPTAVPTPQLLPVTGGKPLDDTTLLGMVAVLIVAMVVGVRITRAAAR